MLCLTDLIIKMSSFQESREVTPVLKCLHQHQWYLSAPSLDKLKLAWVSQRYIAVVMGHKHSLQFLGEERN